MAIGSAYVLRYCEPPARPHSGVILWFAQHPSSKGSASAAGEAYYLVPCKLMSVELIAITF
jgi:hypothetical protein